MIDSEAECLLPGEYSMLAHGTVLYHNWRIIENSYQSISGSVNYEFYCTRCLKKKRA